MHQAAIVTNQFSISVGRGGENVAFMNHTWDHQNPINYVAFASSNYRTVDWNIPTNGINNAICLMLCNSIREAFIKKKTFSY